MRLPSQDAKIVGIYVAALSLGLLGWFGVELHRAGFTWNMLGSIDSIRALWDIEYGIVAGVLVHFVATGQWEMPPPPPNVAAQPPPGPAPAPALPPPLPPITSSSASVTVSGTTAGEVPAG